MASGIRFRMLPLAAALVISSSSFGRQASADLDLPLARIGLQPVVTGGLASPIYVTNAHDGSNRLFIVEQPGRIKVLQPGSTAPSVFLDITSKVLSGGERGLLGLAFHPQSGLNRRFFVDYTRKPDGATVIAEYKIAAGDANLADPAESVLLTIDQPYANHNGGMLEFGPDGFLYIGMGDGGSSNDPGNRAQNPRELLGKILRIDVDHADPGKAYRSPPGNPFYGSSDGRDEIYALGLRNPWRFSFDRATGLLYAGDVGQDLIEEIDLVAAGGNYGWRILEGNRCANPGPAPCTAAGFIPPIAEYSHDNGRCSITGGYVYRGTQASLPFGSYVYGDFCTGEVFLLNGDTQSVLMKGTDGISSFGEDESGEIYIVGINGTVHRIVNPDAPSKPTVYFPRLVSTFSGQAGQNESTGFAVANFSGESTGLTFTAYDSEGTIISGSNINNPESRTLAAGNQVALLDTQVFGGGLPLGSRPGWVRLESSVREIAAFFLGFYSNLTLLEGAEASSTTPGFTVLPEIEAQGTTQVHVVNPYAPAASISLRLIAADGTLRASASRNILGNGSLIETTADLFPGIAASSSDYIQVVSNQGMVSFEYLSRSGADASGLNGQDATAGASTLYSPQYVTGGRYFSAISVINLDSTPGTVNLRLFADDGTPLGSAQQIAIPAKGKIHIDDPGYLTDFGPTLTQGYLEVSSSGLRLAGSMFFGDRQRKSFAAAVPLVSSLKKNLIFSQVASNSVYFTGIALLNPGAADAKALVEVFDQNGRLIHSAKVTVKARGRSAGLLTEFFPALAGQDIHSGYIRISSDRGILACALFGTNDLTALSAIS